MTVVIPILLENEFVDLPKVVDVLPLSTVKIRWSFPFGIQRIEVTVRPRSRIDLFERYRSHYGLRMAIFGRSWAARPVAVGQVFEIVPSETSLTYILAGTGQRFFDQLDETNYPTTDTTSDVVGTMISDHVPVVDDTKLDGIADTGTAVGAWDPSARSAGVLVPELLDFSDNQARQWDFWIKTAFSLGPSAPRPLAFMQPRDPANTTPTWRVFRRDLTQNGLSFSRHIWDLRRSIKIYYGVIGGGPGDTHNAGNNKAYLQDSGASFVSDGVKPGDMVRNITDGSSARVTTVLPSGKRLDLDGLTGGTDDDFDNGDVYSVMLMDSPLFVTSVSTISDDLHVVEYSEIRLEMDAAQAQQYADALLAVHELPVNQNSFTIGAARIQHSSGALLPLWMMLQQGGGIIRLEDFQPLITLLTAPFPRLQNWQIVAMDYDSATNRMRIVPTSKDGRLDMILKRAGLIRTESAGA